MRRKKTQANRSKQEHKSRQTMDDATRALAKADRRIDAFAAHRTGVRLKDFDIIDRAGVDGSRVAQARGSQTDQEPLLTIPEVAEILKVSPQRVYEMARTGLLPVVRLGRQVRVAPLVLREWIAGGGVRPEGEQPTPFR